MSKNKKRVIPFGRRQVEKVSESGKRRYIYPKQRKWKHGPLTREGNLVDQAEKKLLKKLGKIAYPTVDSCLRVHVHSKNTFFMVMDIADAFGSVTAKMIKKMDDRDPFVYQIKEGNKNFFFHTDGSLIQGASTSSALFEIYCNNTLDRKLKKYCGDRGVIFTRFRDDMIFSSARFISKNMRRKIRNIIYNSSGLVVNRTKTRVKRISKTSFLEVLGCVSKIGEGKKIFTGPSEKVVQKIDDMESICDLSQVSLEDFRRYRGLKNWQRDAMKISERDFGKKVR